MKANAIDFSKLLKWQYWERRYICNQTTQHTCIELKKSPD